MEKHVKIIGWLWLVNGVLGIILVLPGLTILNLTDSIPNAGDAVLITLGSLFFSYLGSSPTSWHAMACSSFRTGRAFWPSFWHSSTWYSCVG